MSLMAEPTAEGRFGEFGGRFVPETLMTALNDLTVEYLAAPAAGHERITLGSGRRRQREQRHRAECSTERSQDPGQLQSAGFGNLRRSGHHCSWKRFQVKSLVFRAFV